LEGVARAAPGLAAQARQAGRRTVEAGPVRRRGRLLAQGTGLVLIALVLWLVGWNDTVTDAGGTTHAGRVVSVTPSEAVFRDGRRIPIEDERAVRRGLGGALASLGRSPWLFLAGVGLHLASLLLTFFRWGILLRGANLPTPLREVFRLGWVGHFLSNVVPGGVAGGDLIKSVYIARAHPERKTRAVVTVVMDRFLGLAAICAIAAAAVLLAPQLAQAAEMIGWIVAALGAGALAAFLLRNRLPHTGVLGEVRLALETYRKAPRSLAVAAAVALCNNALVLAAFLFYGRAVGVELSLLAVGAAVPVAQMLSAVPALPGGWGVGDFAFYFFLPLAGVPAGLAVALSFVFRLSHTVLSLPGGLMLASPRRS
jgi:uncharacterized membrane protein YbhN (UPF0104 family)